MALCGLEEESFFLGEPVADAAAADFGFGGFAAAEIFYVVFAGAGHEGLCNREIQFFIPKSSVTE